MSCTLSPEPALARWLAQGVTSQTHRVLHQAFQDCFRPLGIEAESLEAEPFSALESGQGDWWLRQARWNPDGFDRAHPAAPDFRFLLDAPDHFAVTVDPRGRLWVELAPEFSADPAAQARLQANEHGWRAARHGLRAGEAAEAFILAAAALLLANDAAAAIYAAGDDAAFGRAVHRRLAGASRA
jgi:hypothetical protein